MILSKERKGEIALAVLKYRMKKEGLHLNALKRDLGNEAQALSIPIDELKEFVMVVVTEATEEALRSLVTGEDEKD